MLALLLGTAALAADPAFTFDLTVDGEHTKPSPPATSSPCCSPLQRTDADVSYSMYAMQDEILYDPDFFELVEGGALLTSGVQSTDIALRDLVCVSFYMNYLALRRRGVERPDGRWQRAVSCQGRERHIEDHEPELSCRARGRLRFPTAAQRKT